MVKENINEVSEVSEHGSLMCGSSFFMNKFDFEHQRRVNQKKMDEYIIIGNRQIKIVTYI